MTNNLDIERLHELVDRIDYLTSLDIFFDADDHPEEQHLARAISDLHRAVAQLKELVDPPSLVDLIEHDPTIPEEQKASKYPGLNELYDAERRNLDAQDYWDF